MDFPDRETLCHRTGFATSCRELVTSGKCRRWLTVQGNDPSTGQPINRGDCVDNWTPTLLIENAMLQRQTAAAIDQLRNESIKLQRVALACEHGDAFVKAMETREELRFLAPAAPSTEIPAAEPLKEIGHAGHHDKPR